MAKNFRTEPMRSWASKSYDPKSGMAASKFGSGEAFSVEGRRIQPSNQIEATKGVEALNCSGSGDPGRVKFNRE
jgi:hypothetical protein